MYRDLVLDPSFWQRAVRIDQKLLADAISQGCPHCGGPLHVSNYPRKPQGLSDEFETMTVRFSSCCGKCRKRCTPASVRFLGRRVYVGAVVLLVVAIGFATTATRWTLSRWEKWCTQHLPQSSWWRELRGRLSGASNLVPLPRQLLERCESTPGQESEEGLIGALRLMLPLSTRTGLEHGL